MNPENPTPTVADDRAVTPVARRVGRPVAVVALVVTTALLAWLALAPTAIAGDLTEAPFTVPATLLVGPDDKGCIHLFDGTGEATTHCLDELAVDDRDWVYTESWFDEDGDVQVHREVEDGVMTITLDPATGEVLDRRTTDWETADRERMRADVEEPIEVPVPGIPDPERGQVYTDGDLVRSYDDGPRPGEGDDPVVLDLEAPPGYWLRDAVLSPDGAWVVVTTPSDEVVVAPTDGSAAPYVWAEIPDDRWVNLWGAIRWDE